MWRRYCMIRGSFRKNLRKSMPCLFTWNFKSIWIQTNICNKWLEYFRQINNEILGYYCACAFRFRSRSPSHPPFYRSPYHPYPHQLHSICLLCPRLFVYVVCFTLSGTHHIVTSQLSLSLNGNVRLPCNPHNESVMFFGVSLFHRLLLCS